MRTVGAPKRRKELISAHAYNWHTAAPPDCRMVAEQPPQALPMCPLKYGCKMRCECYRCSANELCAKHASAKDQCKRLLGLASSCVERQRDRGQANPTSGRCYMHACVSKLLSRAYPLPMASSAHARSVPRRQARSDYPLAARDSPRPLPRPHRWPRAAQPPALRASGQLGPGPMQRAGPRALRRCRQGRTRVTQLGSARDVASAPGT